MYCAFILVHAVIPATAGMQSVRVKDAFGAI